MVRALLMGMPKPMVPVRRTRALPAVVMAMTRPELSAIGPPESPGWIPARTSIMPVSVSAFTPPASEAVIV
jgi:hypothetical protein